MVGCPVVEEELVVEGQEGVEVEEGEVQHQQVQAIHLLLVHLLLVMGWQVVAQAEELEAGQEEVEAREGEVQHQQVLVQYQQALAQRGFLSVDQPEQKGQEEGIEGALLKAVSDSYIVTRAEMVVPII